MNAHRRKLTASFELETRFEVPPVPPATFRAIQETELEQLKNRLFLQTLNELSASAASGFVRRAAHEATALAWQTGFPLLVLPELFGEKTRTSLLQVEKQAGVRRRSLELFAAI